MDLALEFPRLSEARPREWLDANLTDPADWLRDRTVEEARDLFLELDLRFSAAGFLDLVLEAARVGDSICNLTLSLTRSAGCFDKSDAIDRRT